MRLITPEKLDRARGCLLAGAYGDALGYPVEFMSLSTIRAKYGPKGIQRLDAHPVFSDDTQMTLFTAEGLLSAIGAGKQTAEDIAPYIEKAYVDWYYTQTEDPHHLKGSWLGDLKTLWHNRAPGNTCMSALRRIANDLGPVDNNSKGCGGVMRVAPIGISLEGIEAGRLAGLAAEVTHKHPLSTFSSMVLAMIVSMCIDLGPMTQGQFRAGVNVYVLKPLRDSYPDDPHLLSLGLLLRRAMDLAVGCVSDEDAIRELGQGWVAEEALAIAIYSVMRHIDDFERCMACAVNHDGDSDSTGAIAGNIIGAILGWNKIVKTCSGVELREVIESIADDLIGASTFEQMVQRYIFHRPFAVDSSLLFPRQQL